MDDGRCHEAFDEIASQLEEVQVADFARVKRSGCLGRQAEQNIVPMVWQSQERQKSPRMRSMFDDIAVGRRKIVEIECGSRMG